MCETVYIVFVLTLDEHVGLSSLQVLSTMARCGAPHTNIRSTFSPLKVSSIRLTFGYKIYHYYGMIYQFDSQDGSTEIHTLANQY